jgi:hypothetical protein
MERSVISERTSFSPEKTWSGPMTPSNLILMKAQRLRVGFVHTWSSPPDSRLILLLGNINQEGIADVIVVK